MNSAKAQNPKSDTSKLEKSIGNGLQTYMN